MPIDSAYAQWLIAEAVWLVRDTPSVKARWGDSAIVTERTTGIATAAAAAVEAERQLLFAARGPFAVDVHQLVGTGWLSMLARVVTLTIDQLGYENGIDVFVLEADVDHATAISTIAVLRPLDGA